ncbi:MAG: DUF4175 family protein [Bacteroidota bacterium]
MSEQTASLLQILRARLQATTRRMTLADLLVGALVVLGGLGALLLVVIAVEAGLWLDVTPRTVLFWGLTALTVGALGYWVLIPALKLLGVLPGVTEEVAARRIGRTYPEVSDRLVNLLQLAEGRRTEAPDALLDGAVRMLGESVREVPFERVENFDRAKRVGRLASLPLVGLLVFVVAAPQVFLGAAQRVFTPGVTFERPAPFSLSVEPGSTSLVRGDSLVIAVRAEGTDLPPVVTLALNNEGEEVIETIPVPAEADGQFAHALINVRQSLRYRVSAGPVTTAWYQVEVVEQPIVQAVRVDLAFPSYTRIPPQRLAPNVGDVTALPGTQVTVQVGLGGPAVAQALVVQDNGQTDSLTVDGSTALGTFTLTREGTYQIRLETEGGLRNTRPIDYTLRLLSDAAPSVVLLAPAPSADLDDQLQAGLRMRLNDDFGFARLSLFYRLAESRFGEPQTDFTEIRLPLEAPRQLDQEVLHAWLLRESTPLDPVPGDVIEYYVQVWDNDRVSGYKTSQSAVQRLRLPSIAEQYEAMDRQQDETKDDLEDLLRDTERTREQFQELRDELRRKQEADWEDERQLEQLQERQEAMEQRVDEMVQQMQELSQQMQQNDLVSEETLEKYQELQKVMEEITTPELQEALQKLQDAMQNMDLQQMQEAIQDFEFSEEQYQQRLERTLELFKQIRVQQEMEALARRLDDMAQRQEQLAEKTAQEEQEAEDAPQGEEQAGEEQDGEGEAQSGEEQEGQQESGEGQEGEGAQEASEQQEGEGEAQAGEGQEGEQQAGEQEASEGQEGEQTSGESPPEGAEALAREQEMNQEEMQQLLEQAQELRQQMEEVQRAPEREMDGLQQQMERLPQQMEQNSEQLRDQQFQPAQQGQQQMQQQMQQMSQQLQEMQQSMAGQQQQVNMAGLRRVLEDILTLSQQQEGLRQTVRGLASDSPVLREMAQRQVEMSEDLTVVTDSLQTLARDIPQMSSEVQKQAGDALREMSNATTSLADRSASLASGYQKGSMMHMNELALLLSELLDQMSNGQSGGGMSMQQMQQQMQQMSQQQQMLNQQIQQMLNDMQGNRLTGDMEARLRQMAAQQEQIRRQIRELSRNREARGQMLGDLNRIAEQMEETIRELQQRQVNRQTLQRQQQILTRMLDAQKSLQQRGEERQREGREFRDLFNRDSPPDLPASEEAEQLRRALIRALESGYAPDYEELIKRYFELLQDTTSPN